MFGRVVDVDGRLGERVHRRGDPREVHLLEEAAPKALRVDVRDARQQPEHELLLAHLQAEDADRLPVAHGRVLGDVQREARLADAGPSGEDHEVALLEPGRECVQVREAGADPAHLAAVLVEVVEAIVRVVEEHPQRREPHVHAPLADREELRLGAVDRRLDVRAVLVPDRGDLARGGDEVPQDCLALDDPRVMDGVDGRGRPVAQRGQVRAPAHALEPPGPLEGLRDGHDVDRLAAFEQLEDGAVDEAVGLTVEVLRAQELGDLHDGVAVDEDRAEDRLLGVDALGREAVDHVSLRAAGCARPSSRSGRLAAMGFSTTSSTNPSARVPDGGLPVDDLWTVARGAVRGPRRAPRRGRGPRLLPWRAPRGPGRVALSPAGGSLR